MLTIYGISAAIRHADRRMYSSLHLHLNAPGFSRNFLDCPHCGSDMLHRLLKYSILSGLREMKMISSGYNIYPRFPVTMQTRLVFAVVVSKPMSIRPVKIK